MKTTAAVVGWEDGADFVFIELFNHVQLVEAMRELFTGYYLPVPIL